MISGQSKVAREFEFTLLRQRVFTFRDSLPLWLKNAHFGRHPAVVLNGEVTFEDGRGAYNRFRPPDGRSRRAGWSRVRARSRSID
jgi:hypothetical protein